MKLSLRLKIILLTFSFIIIFSVLTRFFFVQVIPQNYFENKINDITKQIENHLNNPHLDDVQKLKNIKLIVKSEPFIKSFSLESIPEGLKSTSIKELDAKTVQVTYPKKISNKFFSWTSDSTDYNTIKIACDIALTYTFIFLVIFSLLFSFIVSKSVSRKSENISNILDDIVDGKENLVLKKDVLEDELDTLIEKVNKLNSIYSQNLNELRREKLYKKQLMLSLSHEIKTPIGGINGILEGMLDEIPPYTDRDRYIRECRKLSARLGQITNEMLDVTKMDSLITDKEEIFIAILIEELIDGLNPIVLSKNLRINLKIDNRISIFTDKRLFKRALINLLENAIKYCPFGGLIEVSTKGFVLNIYNDGQALTSDDLYLVFNPLYRGSNKKNSQGKGLGLYIVKECFGALDLPHKIDNFKNGVIFKIALNGGDYES